MQQEIVSQRGKTPTDPWIEETLLTYRDHQRERFPILSLKDSCLCIAFEEHYLKSAS